MDLVVKLLKTNAWKEDGVLKGEGAMVDRPVFAFKNARVLVGPLWTTHYRKTGDDSTDELNSVKTDDVKVVEKMIQNLMVK